MSRVWSLSARARSETCGSRVADPRDTQVPGSPTSPHRGARAPSRRLGALGSLPALGLLGLVMLAGCGNAGELTTGDGGPGGNAADGSTGAGGFGAAFGAGGAGGDGGNGNGAGGGLPGGADMAVVPIEPGPDPSAPDSGVPPDPNRPPRDCAAQEICETPEDDDCDGRTDEGCVCRSAEKPCYTGDPRDLLPANTACRMGVQACELEIYGPCRNDVRPTAETCNGLDDDCDGRTDEDAQCAANTPPVALCPPEQVGPPLSRFALEGGYADADGDDMARATWRVVEAPAGATGRPDPANRLSTSFFADLQGEYLLELEVEDARGAVGRCTTLVRATASDDDFRVELVWNAGAADDRSDVDLHLKRGPNAAWHAVGRTGDDCHWRNCSVCSNEGVGGGEDACRAYLSQVNQTPAGPPPQVEWSAPLDADDPRLDLDDVDGNGPENINIRSPRNGTWRVGVHYWDDDGFGASTVSVRIFCGGLEAAAFPPVVLEPTGNNGDEDTEFWEVADVIWSGGTCEVRALGTPQCPRICSDGEAKAAGCPSGRTRGRPCP